MKYLKYIGIAALIGGVLFATAFFIKSNSTSSIVYDTQTLITATIEDKIVATGKVLPEDEVNIVPQIAGIIQEILVEEGDELSAGDLIARIKVVPNEQTLNSAEGRVKSAQIVLKNSKIEFERNKALFSKEIISEQDFNSVTLRYNQDMQNLSNAKSDLQIIKLGSSGGSTITNTNVRATVSGTILEIPVKEGDQVIQANTFNAGTTIATIADLDKMIFEGQVDEGEVGKLSVDMPLIITLGAIEGKEYEAKLKLISPKGTEVGGAIQFKIEGEVYLDDEYVIRAGYSANASIVSERKVDVIAISEALLQYDSKTKKPYVEIETSNQKFKRQDVKLGISDGVNAELISGVSKTDKIKVWNKTEPDKRGEVEDNGWN
ncbi:MAG: efflux RND transporter periplasmic adaptor subunit [Flavobacteriaceae bacterium]|jgi:HlyD family secretion protein|nr:efflux transporter periplasmic adaptor subunit [Flavobacteriaceae bacterium]RZP08760.1 MAG: efflux RND transporter periplasmic adaptor subunit [Flavobacteriales bacterium]MDC0378400.1 efflux RND transporter periplasmic adaptor subunit [Flavobacteriaceae bacterium]MDC1459204.1 efflux RND transporter periplasmic adaptor subunit [Flavobacteriaceae bacterium]MDG1344630.1 efflux RND transporter periplasmic adaptor subunit [Flavobacteriaceae bacterium]|tara:strand:+ start:3167 stop:4294 length:1128 start_codon:yes stop_codon:yes gene_type:complete